MDTDHQADEAWVLDAQRKLYQWSKANPDDAWRDMWNWVAEEKVSITTRNGLMSGVKFLFRVTLRHLDLAEQIYHLNEPQRSPAILSDAKRRKHWPVQVFPASDKPAHQRP